NQPIDDKATAKGLTLEGKITRISYSIGNGKSTLEVERNYLEALQKGGFQVQFRCAEEKCGSSAFQDFVANSGKVMPAGAPAAFGRAHRSILAKLARPTGDAYVFLHIMDDTPGARTLVYEEVVEVKPMQTGQVQVLDASALQKSLTSSGKVALYGIY